VIHLEINVIEYNLEKAVVPDTCRWENPENESRYVETNQIHNTISDSIWNPPGQSPGSRNK
jgi:hypothetical protein